MNLAPEHEHDLWVAVFTAALSESAIKLIDSPGTPATGGDRVGPLVGKAVEIANLAQELYRDVWGAESVGAPHDPVLSLDERTTVVRALRASYAKCSADEAKFSVADLRNTRVLLIRAMCIFGIADTVTDADMEAVPAVVRTPEG